MSHILDFKKCLQTQGRRVLDFFLGGGLSSSRLFLEENKIEKERGANALSMIDSSSSFLSYLTIHTNSVHL